MLRIVEPSQEGQEKRARKPRKSYLSPPPDEQKRILAAIKNIARAYGGRDVLATVMGVSVAHLGIRKRKRSYGFAVLLARAAGISLEALLSPLKSVEVCPTCGARKGA